MSKVVCFGEIMLRLSPPGYLRFVQANSFDATYGGSEANVSVSLANFGMDAAYVTKVPDNPIGQAVVNELRRYGVNTEHIVRGGERLGIYFYENGVSQRPSKVLYDRKYSSISQAGLQDFNWKNIFRDAEWFHFTGINPALGDNMAQITLEACKAAKKMNLKVSCDLNYRKNLWSYEEAGKVMSGLMQYVDLCIINEEHAEKVFGIKADNTDFTGGELSHEGYRKVADRLKSKFGFEKVAITLRESISASDNNLAAMLYDGEEYYFSRSYLIHIVDRVGGGDAFAGGLIYAIVNGWNSKDALEFAVAASCLKHSIEGDFNHVTLAETEALMNGDASGRVQR